MGIGDKGDVALARTLVAANAPDTVGSLWVRRIGNGIHGDVVDFVIVATTAIGVPDVVAVTGGYETAIGLVVAASLLVGIDVALRVVECHEVHPSVDVTPFVARVVLTVHALAGSNPPTAVFVLHIYIGRNLEVGTVAEHEGVVGTHDVGRTAVGAESLADGVVLAGTLVAAVAVFILAIDVMEAEDVVEQVVRISVTVAQTTVVNGVLNLLVGVELVACKAKGRIVGEVEDFDGVLHADEVADKDAGRLDGDDVVLTEQQGVDTAEAIVGRSVGTEGILLASEVDEDAVEDDLVGTLYGGEFLADVGAGVVVAIVTHSDETVDVAALGRCTGADDAVGNVHRRQQRLTRVLKGGAVAATVDEDVGLATEDATGVEVGVVAGFAPVAGIVDRCVEHKRLASGEGYAACYVELAGEVGEVGLEGCEGDGAAIVGAVLFGPYGRVVDSVAAYIYIY